MTKLRISLVLSILLSGSVLLLLAWGRASGGGSENTYLPLVMKPGDGGPTAGFPIVFVSRQIPDEGSIYWDEPYNGVEPPNAIPGVGSHGRFRVAAPGKLIIREADGTVRTLVDGSNPTPASLNLIDVNAPDVSYDGTKIVFAGLPPGNYNLASNNNPSAWRIYTINMDGSGLQQVTFSDQNLNMSQFGPAAGGLGAYDDTDPVWLPDGRITFTSTRWPSYAQYSGVRTTNLYVVNADGSDLHRITAERNGADRPEIDPVTGKIVYARWWRNHRFAINDMSTIPDGAGYARHLGLSANRNEQMDGLPQFADYLWRNAWQAATINPDGAGLAMWGGAFRDEMGNHVYGGAFTDDGRFLANFYPMFNMTEASGFGGIRLYERGAHSYQPVLGIVETIGGNYANDDPVNGPSYGIYNSDLYATDAVPLPDGRYLVSITPDMYQDYGIYVVNLDGSRTLVYDNPGTTELRAKLVRARPLPPILPDNNNGNASLLPPTANPPYDIDGTFVFDALNVYFNGPVDMDIVNAPPIGSAQTIRFFLDQQRTAPGSFPALDWPILLGELPIAANGAVQDPNAPANVPLFEQLRSPEGTVPLTAGPYGNDGAAHVAGMNYGPPGTVARCVGCHAGHTMIPVPANPADAQWTNLAPGATVTVSSTRDPQRNRGLIDRRVLKGEIWRYWTSQNDQPADGQWVQLTLPVPVRVRLVRLYNPRFGGEANSSLQVHSATVRLYSDVAATNEVAAQTINQNLAVSGTDVAFADVLVRVVRVELNDVSGTFYGLAVAGLAEIEVIGRGE